MLRLNWIFEELGTQIKEGPRIVRGGAFAKKSILVPIIYSRENIAVVVFSINRGNPETGRFN